MVKIAESWSGPTTADQCWQNPVRMELLHDIGILKEIKLFGSSSQVLAATHHSVPFRIMEVTLTPEIQPRVEIQVSQGRSATIHISVVCQISEGLKVSCYG